MTAERLSKLIGSASSEGGMLAVIFWVTVLCFLFGGVVAVGIGLCLVLLGAHLGSP